MAELDTLNAVVKAFSYSFALSNSRIFLQLNNGKIVTLLFAGAETCGTLVRNDKNENTRILIGSFVFSKENFEVFIARDGAEAIEIAELNMPDIILLDIMMPNVDGYQVLKFLKESHKLNDIKVIFLSAKNKVSDIELGLQLGADKYITKPFSTKKIVKEVQDLLK